MPQPLKRPKAMAEQLGVSTRTLIRWAKARIIPAFHPTPRLWLFDPDAVLEALRQRTEDANG